MKEVISNYSCQIIKKIIKLKYSNKIDGNSTELSTFDPTSSIHRRLESFIILVYYIVEAEALVLSICQVSFSLDHNSTAPQQMWCHSVKTNISVLLQTMRRIRLSIHQHKPRTLYLGLTPMLNHCRLSGSLNLLSVSSPRRGWGIRLKSAARAGIRSQSPLNSLLGTSRRSARAALARKITP